MIAKIILVFVLSLIGVVPEAFAAYSPSVNLTLADNVYPLMSSQERAAQNRLIRQAVAYARPSVVSTYAPKLVSNQAGYILRRGFAFLGPVAATATLAMTAHDLYLWAISDPNNKKYFDGKPKDGVGKELPEFGTTADLPEPNDLIVVQGGTYKVVSVSYLYRYTGTNHTELPDFARPNPKKDTDFTAIYAVKYPFGGWSVYQIGIAAPPPPTPYNPVDGGLNEFYDAITENNEAEPFQEPFPDMLAGIDKAMADLQDTPKVEYSPTPDEMQALKAKVDAQNIYDQQVQQAQEYMQQTAAAAEAAAQAKDKAQVRYNMAASNYNQYPTAENFKELNEALAALTDAEAFHAAATNTAEQAEAAKAEAEAQAQREKETSEAAIREIPENDYDANIDVPEMKAIPDLLRSWVASSPIAAMLSSFTLSTSDATGVVNAGQFYGSDIDFDFERYTDTFNILGGVLLVVVHGFAVMIVMRGWNK